MIRLHNAATRPISIKTFNPEFRNEKGRVRAHQSSQPDNFKSVTDSHRANIEFRLDVCFKSV